MICAARYCSFCNFGERCFKFKSCTTPVVNLDFELRRGPSPGGPVLFYLPSRLFFPQSFLPFSPKIRGAYPRSATGLLLCAIAFTKAIDLKLHLSLTCEPTTSRQKHFSTSISLPATHQGSINVSSKTKHLGCFEITPQGQLFKKISDNSTQERLSRYSGE